MPTLLYGVGDITGIMRPTIEHKKAYKVWSHMLERCYSESCILKHPTYIYCYVETSWLKFKNFLVWFNENYIKDYFLDKDLKKLGNKEYSEKYCSFVPRTLNNLLINSKNSRGKYPVGVTEDSKNIKGIKYTYYKARFSANGQSNYLGLFSTIAEAQVAYNIAKSDHIITYSNKNNLPQEIKATLLQAANYIRRGKEK